MSRRFQPETELQPVREMINEIIGVNRSMINAQSSMNNAKCLKISIFESLNASKCPQINKFKLVPARKMNHNFNPDSHQPALSKIAHQDKIIRLLDLITSVIK